MRGSQSFLNPAQGLYRGSIVKRLLHHGSKNKYVMFAVWLGLSNNMTWLGLGKHNLYLFNLVETQFTRCKLNLLHRYLRQLKQVDVDFCFPTGHEPSIDPNLHFTSTFSLFVLCQLTFFGDICFPQNFLSHENMTFWAYVLYANDSMCHFSGVAVGMEVEQFNIYWIAMKLCRVIYDLCFDYKSD